ncbi:MAG TPA: cbb3-type cytochrome oxidase assembly protein CcoS [Kofleriaceae bacterium]|nr:cbb3-type cytochrome oxidase assembly protein CcoS [Kofleriaceae bacterium]
MAALYFILPLALLVAAGAVLAFAWSVRTGQLDDLETPPRRMLLDDAPRPPPTVARPAAYQPAFDDPRLN